MLDPITALSVAAAVVQFVDFSANLITKARKIHKTADGSTSEIVELQRMVAELQQLNSRILSTVNSAKSTPTARPGKKAGIQDANIARGLANDCSELSDKILLVLNDFKIQGDPGWLKSIKVAHKVERRKPELAEIQRQLASIRSRIHTELLSAFKDRESNMGERLLRLEDRQIKDKKQHVELTAKLRDLHDFVSTALSEQSNDLARLLAGYVDEAKKVQANKRLLSSLRFDKMRSREDAIAQRHDGTFEWIFESPDWTRRYKGVRVWFSEWLAHSNGIFWVSGKAGSGKSTLMKYLSSNSATCHLLNHWASTRKLVIASHFFWSTGDELQNSQLGLLRTLCHEVLRSCPDLIAIILKEHWNPIEDDSESWTLADLSRMIDIIRSTPLTANQESVAFCFFVDGLDEYRGDHSDIITLLRNLASSEHVKICASSRPWNIFEDAFGGEPERKLLLQDLTWTDIERYVNDKLIADQRFLSLVPTRPETDEIVTEIQTMAQGVFLWVFLVVRELLKSVVNGDSFADLQRRLRSLPPDLERFFQHIFDTLDPFYKQQTARAFLLCLHAVTNLPVLAYCVIDRNDSITKHLLDDGKSAAWPELDRSQALLAKRINARARDLLEPTTIEGSGSIVHVDFLHRTVRDFLITQDMIASLTVGAGDDFDLWEALCWAQWVVLRRVMPTMRVEEIDDDVVNDLAFYARQLEQKRKLPAHQMLDRLQNYLKDRTSLITVPSLVQRLPCEARDSFWRLVLRHKLGLYVRRRLELQSSLSKDLLGYFPYALSFSGITRLSEHEATDTELIELLLKHGADPNMSEGSSGKRVWLCWLDELNGNPSLMADEDFSLRTLRITELLLRYGAHSKGGDRAILVDVYGEVETERLLAVATNATSDLHSFSLSKLYFWR